MAGKAGTFDYSDLLSDPKVEQPHEISIADIARHKYAQTGPKAPRNGNRHPGNISRDLPTSQRTDQDLPKEW